MTFIAPELERLLGAPSQPGLLTSDGVGALRAFLEGAEDRPADVESNSPVRVEAVGRGRDERILIWPRSGEARGVIFAIHGGGLVAGSPYYRMADICEHLADLHFVIVMPKYAFAPESPYPAAIDDIQRAWRWTADAFIDLPGPRVIWGGSAGGMLAATLAFRELDGGKARADYLMLLQPMLDDKVREPRSASLEGRQLWDYSSNALAWEMYRGARSSRETEMPGRRESLAGLPPLFLEIGQADVLRSSALEFAERASREGVSVEVHMWPGATHGFEATTTARIAQAAWHARIEFLRRTLQSQS